MTIYGNRGETRIDVSMDLQITKFLLGDNKIVNLKKILPMRAVNLSASGILLSSSLDLPTNLRPHLEISINGENISCLAEIVRKEQNEAGYNYGCRLFFPNENEKSVIRKHILDMQLKSLRLRTLSRDFSESYLNK